MTQMEITRRQLRLALIADWNATVSFHDRVSIINYCAQSVDEHVPLSTMQNVLPRLYATSQMLRGELEALRCELRFLSGFDIDDIVHMLVQEVVNVQVDWMKLTDIDDYDLDEQNF